MSGGETLACGSPCWPKASIRSRTLKFSPEPAACRATKLSPTRLSPPATPRARGAYYRLADARRRSGPLAGRAARRRRCRPPANVNGSPVRTAQQARPRPISPRSRRWDEWRQLHVPEEAVGGDPEVVEAGVDSHRPGTGTGRMLELLRTTTAAPSASTPPRNDRGGTRQLSAANTHPGCGPVISAIRWAAPVAPTLSSSTSAALFRRPRPGLESAGRCGRAARC